MRIPKQPKIDMDELHRLYMAGVPIMKIAHELFIDQTYCSALIKDQRLAEPDKWPRRELFGRKKKAVEVKKAKVKIEATYKREPPSTESANGKCNSFHISALPQEEQERMMNLVDPNRNTKPAFGGGWGMLP